MNQPLFLHIVEKLEGLLAKLPTSIQKPILHELTPLKELFLQQRPPRLLIAGTSKLPLLEILPALFATPPGTDRNVLLEVFHWQNFEVASAGTVSLLDARDADDHALLQIRHELERQPADLILFLDNGDSRKTPATRETENLGTFANWNATGAAEAKILGVSLFTPGRSVAAKGHDEPNASTIADRRARLHTALVGQLAIRDRLQSVVELPLTAAESNSAARAFMTLLAENLPNQARIEMIRISRDREAQAKVAQTLVKSTSAICTAIGAQPIPLADLPVLTTLQLVMVSGIMYMSGRERSLRAATEFIGALGANVGAGMLLREGTRAMLKFFPGWGNVLCGMVAGAGTYAIGRASIAYFIEGVTLRDARRTYLQSRRKKSSRARLADQPAGQP